MRLVAFGDSFTHGYGISDSIKWKGSAHPNKFEDFYRRMNSWPRYLAEKLDIPFINMGQCAIGNKEIYEIIKENVDEILDDDLIIVAFSFPYRNTTSPNDDYKKIDEILKNHNRYYFNAFYPTFNDEEPINIDFSRFIRPDYSFASYLQNVEKAIQKPLFENNCWYSPLNIEGNQHPNLEGYKHIAQFIYDELKEKLNLL